MVCGGRSRVVEQMLGEQLLERHNWNEVKKRRNIVREVRSIFYCDFLKVRSRKSCELLTFFVRTIGLPPKTQRIANARGLSSLPPSFAWTADSICPALASTCSSETKG